MRSPNVEIDNVFHIPPILLGVPDAKDKDRRKTLKALSVRKILRLAGFFFTAGKNSPGGIEYSKDLKFLSGYGFFNNTKHVYKLPNDTLFYPGQTFSLKGKNEKDINDWQFTPQYRAKPCRLEFFPLAYRGKRLLFPPI